jgi:hypothetical protein
MHVNIKQEPHVEEEYQVCTRVTVNWWCNATYVP